MLALIGRGLATWPHSAPDWSKVRAVVGRAMCGGGAFFVAEERGRPVGYLVALLGSAPFHDERILAVMGLYVEAPGVGLPLLLRARRVAKSLDAVLQVSLPRSSRHAINHVSRTFGGEARCSPSPS